MCEPAIKESRHFELHAPAEGVFAAIARDGGSAIGNAGVIDLGGQTVIFDTFLTPQAAADLRRATTDALGPASRIVVNSHYHNDHIWGNQVFAPDAQIVSSRRTHELIATAGAEEFEWYTANSAQRLESLRAQDATADERRQKESLLWIGYYQGLVEALPHLVVCMPTITFDDRLEIHGSRHTAELIAFEGAHTGNDTVLHLRAAGVVFMSDLLFVGCHPWLADGDPLQLLRALRDLRGLHARWYVPGHGPVGTVDDVDLLIEYVEHCQATARELVERGYAAEGESGELAVPEKFAQWQLRDFYEANIRFLCERFSSGSGGT